MAIGIPRGEPATQAVGIEVAVVILISTVPTPLYQLYQDRFRFSPATLTLIFSAYVVGAIVAMLFLGHLADQIGRRPVMMAAVVISAVSAVAFILVRSTVWLYPPRVISGAAVALAGGTSTAWIAGHDPTDDPARATRVALTYQNVGLAVGALYAGMLAQWAPVEWRLRLPYYVFLILLVPTALMVWRTPREIENPKPLREASFKPVVSLPEDSGLRFVGAAVGAFAVYAVTGFFTSLIPNLLSESLHIRSVAAAGAVVALFNLANVVILPWRPAMEPRRGVIISLVALIAGVVCLVAAQALASLTLLLVSTIVGGLASGLGYRATLQEVNDMSSSENRAGVVSLYMIVLYLGLSIPVLGVGFLVSHVGSLMANVTFGLVVIALSLGAIGAEWRMSSSK
ncbi:MAG TPA: MFS transporter [Gemmatimonadaceae bacterium]|nr:MFS transporter [Gemmatimonadaceae bacterium]